MQGLDGRTLAGQLVGVVGEGAESVESVGGRGGMPYLVGRTL